MPAFPAVALRLMKLLDDGESSMASIAASVATDPMLSAELIRRSNSAEYPHYCEVRDVLQATVALGTETTRHIVLASATRVFAGSAAQAAAFRPCWHHTLACALTASELARLCGMRPVEAYTAGLLHDVGRLGLLNAYPAEFEEILAAGAAYPEELLEREWLRFGIDHTQAGVWLAAKWNLPEAIAEAIAGHHKIPPGPVDQLAVLQIACRLADLFGFSVCPPKDAATFEDVTALLSPAVRERLRPGLPGLRDAIAQEIEFFEGTAKPAAGGAADAGAEGRREEPLVCTAPPAAEPATGRRLHRALAGALVAGAIGAAALFYWR